jgi:cytochrome c-type biogenesis protein CcmH/NrfG
MAQDFDPHRLIGTTLGSRFEVTGCVSADEAGALYESGDSELLSPASLRVLHHVRPDDASLRRLLTLLTEVSNLSLPGMRQLRAVGRTRAQDVYYAFDEVRGQSLGQLLEKGPLAVPEAVRIICEVCEILGRAHLHSLVHGALHPGAIIVAKAEGASAGAVQVIDFGLGPLIMSEAVLSAGNRGATVAYQSPEQAKSEPFNHRADIYALGALLFECLSGRQPYAGRSALEVLALQLRGEAPSLAEVDPTLEGTPLQAVINQSMQVSPDARFATADEMIVALRNAGRAESQRKRPAPGAKRPAPGAAAKDQKPDKRPPPPAERRAAEQRKAAEQRRIAQAWAPAAPKSRFIGGYVLGGLLIAGAIGLVVYYTIRPPAVIPTSRPPAATAAEPADDTDEEPETQKAPPTPRRRPRPLDENDAGTKNAAFEEAIKAQAQPLPPEAVKLIDEAEDAMRAKRYTTAISRYASAKRLAPDAPTISRGLGFAYMNSGETSSAVREFERYLELSPDASDAHVVRATIASLRE